MAESVNECSIEKCQIFDFMANIVGITVLHPGGYKATDELARLCKISKNTKVLDIACGKGTSSCYLAERFDCEVVGIDIDENLVSQAKKLAAKREGKLTFKVANAESIPFSDGEFDVSICQAILVLVDDKKKVIKEAIRATKPGGYIGVLEPTWQKQPPKEFFEKDAQEICAQCFRNFQTYDGWRNLIFTNFNLEEVQTKRYGWETQSMAGMIRDEGSLNTTRVMLKWLFTPRIRKRMNAINDCFKRNMEYFGYGIYVGKRPE